MNCQLECRYYRYLFLQTIEEFSSRLLIIKSSQFMDSKYVK